MAIKPVNVVAPFWFTPEDQRDDPNPTRFQLKALDGKQALEVLSGVHGGSMSPECVNSCLKYGLVGWENFTEADGKPIKFVPTNYGRIPPETLSEIIGVIIDHTQLGEDDKKNF